MRVPSSKHREALTKQIAGYHNNLSGAKAYLADRGITPATAEKFLLGYDTETNRLTIPYLTPAGPWLIKRRCIEQHNCKEHGHDKYMNDPGVELHLFNAQTLRDARFVVVVEGELDAIAAEQAGLHAVGYPGASTWKSKPHFRWTFDSADEIAVVADGDDPGRKAAVTVTESLRQAVSAEVKCVVLPDGEDTNSFLLKYGEIEYLELLDWL